MNDYINALIFDRTAADIQELTVKAFIDCNDLNRIEAAVNWVSYALNTYGYKNKVDCKLNWKPGDRRSDKEMERLRKNINTLRKAYYTLPETPLTPDKITYTSIYQANAIEKIIYDIGILAENMSPGLNHLSFKLGTKTIGNRSISL